MKAAKFGKYLRGQLKNLSAHERVAAAWWLTKGDEIFPSQEWIDESEDNYNASFLIADIKMAFEDGREIDFDNYFKTSYEYCSLFEPPNQTKIIEVVKIPFYKENGELLGYLSPEQGGEGFFLYLPDEDEHTEYCHERDWAIERLNNYSSILDTADYGVMMSL